MEPSPFITLVDVTLRMWDQWLLPHTSWQVKRGENWVVWGANGAGKTTLARALMGEVAVVQGCIRRHYQNAPWRGRTAMAMVSSDQYHQLVHRERLLAEMRHFSGCCNEITAAGEILYAAGISRGDSRQWHVIEKTLALKPLLAKPVEALSIGLTRSLSALPISSAWMPAGSLPVGKRRHKLGGFAPDQG